MRVRGNLHEITNVAKFVTSYQANPASPDPTTFKAMAGVQVHLVSDFPLGFNNPLAKSVVRKAKTTKTGAFTISIPAGLPQTARAYLLVYRTVGTVMGVPVPGPVYRSETFKLSEVKEAVQKIYVAISQAPNSAGITQAELAEPLKKARNQLKLKSLTAFIGDGSVHVVAKKSGATAKFDIVLRPSTTHNLESLISHRVTNMDVDLPGPDWLTGLCVSEEQIEREIKSGVSGMLSGFNATIKNEVIAEISRQTGIAEVLVRAVFDQEVSLTFEKIRYPVVAEKKIGWMTVKMRAIVPDPCFGLPRKLFK